MTSKFNDYTIKVRLNAIKIITILIITQKDKKSSGFMKKEMVKLTNNIILNSLQKNAMIAYKNEILKINDQSSVYGLTLTPDDVEEVIKSRGYSLKTYGRIDLNMDATKKIINKIYTSK